MDVYKRFYRLRDSTMEFTKISKLLSSSYTAENKENHVTDTEDKDTAEGSSDDEPIPK